MTLKECYDALGGNFDDVMGRMYDEDFVKMFVIKFPDDNNYKELCRAMSEGDHPSALRAAHTLKGICLNMAFSKLAKSSSALTESLRKEITGESYALMEQVEIDYKETVAPILQLKNG